MIATFSSTVVAASGLGATTVNNLLLKIEPQSLDTVNVIHTVPVLRPCAVVVFAGPAVTVALAGFSLVHVPTAPPEAVSVTGEAVCRCPGPTMEGRVGNGFTVTDVVE